MDPVTIALLLGGLSLVGSLGSNLFNWFSTKEVNDKQIASNEFINNANIKAAQSASDVDYVRNSISNQVSQYRAAGLNPQLGGQSFVASQSITPDLQQLSSLKVPHMSDPVSSGLSSFSVALDGLSNSQLKTAQARKAGAETSGIETINSKQAELLEAQIDELRSRRDNQIASTAESYSRVNLNLSNVDLNSYQIQKLEQDIRLGAARERLTDQQYKDLVYRTNNLLPQLVSEMKARITLEQQQAIESAARSYYYDAQSQNAYAAAQYYELMPDKIKAEISRITIEERAALASALNRQDEHDLKMAADLLEYFDDSGDYLYSVAGSGQNPKAWKKNSSQRKVAEQRQSIIETKYRNNTKDVFAD